MALNLDQRLNFSLTRLNFSPHPVRALRLLVCAVMLPLTVLPPLLRATMLQVSVRALRLLVRAVMLLTRAQRLSMLPLRALPPLMRAVMLSMHVLCLSVRATMLLVSPQRLSGRAAILSLSALSLLVRAAMLSLGAQLVRSAMFFARTLHLSVLAASLPARTAPVGSFYDATWACIAPVNACYDVGFERTMSLAGLFEATNACTASVVL